MKNQITFVLLFFCFTNIFELTAQIRSRKECEAAKVEFDNGLIAFQANKLSKADSLFTAAIRLAPFSEGFYQRAQVRKQLGKTKEYCSDLFASAYLSTDSSYKNCCDMCEKKSIKYFDNQNNLANENNYTYKYEYYMHYVDSLVIVIKYEKEGDKNVLLEHYSVKNEKDTVWIGGTYKPTNLNKEKNVLIKNKNEDAIVNPEKMPIFPGGDEAISKYMSSIVTYPIAEKKRHISDTAYVNFCIDKEGYVCEVKVVRGIKNGEGLDKEAAKAILFMPRWTPGYADGRPVKVSYTYPVSFRFN